MPRVSFTPNTKMKSIVETRCLASLQTTPYRKMKFSILIAFWLLRCKIFPVQAKGASAQRGVLQIVPHFALCAKKS